MIGVYKITNKKNNKAYIGQSRNICVRWNEHCCGARSGKASPLYDDMRKWGLENFTFEILAVCAVEDLNETEEHFVNIFKTNLPEFGYNLTPDGDIPHRSHETNGNAKLTTEKVAAIRRSYANIESKREVFERFKNEISFATFSDIWTGKTWKDIMPEVYTKDNKKRHAKAKAKNAKRLSVFSPEEIIFIRDKKNELCCKKTIYETFFKDRSIHSFNDVWYNRVFPQYQSSVPPHLGKRGRDGNQRGAHNPSARYSQEDVETIRSRKQAGESAKSVYEDYKDKSLYQTFLNLWNNKTYQ